MKLTMMQKMLVSFSLLTIASIVSISIVYYTLFDRHLNAAAQRQSELAFEFIFEDTRNIIADTIPRIETFLGTLLAGDPDLLAPRTYTIDPQRVSDAQLYQLLPGILSRYRDSMIMVQSAAPDIGIDQLVIYDANGRARIHYRHDADRDQLGAYIHTDGGGAFIPFGTQQLSPVAAQLIHFLSPEEIRQVFENPMPPDVAKTHTHPVAGHSRAFLGTIGSEAAIGYEIPLRAQGVYVGVCLLYAAIRQETVARYAHYSQSEIDFFAGERFSVGTLAHEDARPQVTQVEAFELKPPSLPEIQYTEISIDGQPFLQGFVAVGQSTADPVVITVNFPRRLLIEQRNTLLVSISAVACICIGIAILVSTVIGNRVDRFIQQIIRYLNLLAKGDVPEKITADYKGELKSIRDNLNSLVRNYGETVEIARQIADGNLDVHATERSPADLLSQSLNQMAGKLQAMLQRLAAEKEKAEAANRSKSAFLANMSHELRTPLNAVLGFSQLMRQSSEATASQREHLDIINHAGTHLLTLINAVLDMSKIEAGHSILDASDFDLRQLVTEVAAMMRVRADAKGLSLELKGIAYLPRFAHGDAPKLRQILINLLSNAIKYTPQGTVSLSVWARSGPEDIHLTAAVADTGPGIPAKEMDRIFTPFEQLSGASEQNGTGLGLAITKAFVELMGGSIGVQGAAGRGTEFRFSIVLARPETRDAVLPTRAGQEVIGLEPGQPEIRVLIVEDQRDNRLLLEMLIKKVGLAARTAADGAEAITAFEEWRPHFIWMDQRMPVMDGATATRHIRGLPGGREVKIAVLTASVFSEQRRDMLSAGADDFVTKPFLTAQIYACMQRHLDLRYTYADTGVGEPEGHRGDAQGSAEAVPDIERLEALPKDLRQALERAVVALDLEASHRHIRLVAERDPALAAHLESLVDRFDFKAVRQLFDGTRS